MEVRQLEDGTTVLDCIAGCDGVGTACLVESAGGVSGVLLRTLECLGFFREIVHSVAEITDVG